MVDGARNAVRSGLSKFGPKTLRLQAAWSWCQPRSAFKTDFRFKQPAVLTASAQQRKPMKYMISWFERPQGSPMEYENVQKRILEVFTKWKAPANFKIEMFVVRVGEWGGHMLVDCDDPLAVHKFCSMLPAFEMQAQPVIPVEDAVRAELEVIAWRDGLKRS
jgi:hypothetical protein